MAPGDKELLIKDLCGRLPYNIEVEYNNVNCEVLSIDTYNEELTIRVCPGYSPIVKLENVKPYLFPMSSMTEEQRIEFRKIMDIVEARCVNACCKGGFTLSYTDLNDWLNKNHFDYRGLIPKKHCFRYDRIKYLLKYMINYNKPIKFRFVITDDNDNILEVLYEFKKEYLGRWDSEWSRDCYRKVLELDEIYDFDDYENCPNITIQICYNEFWEFYEDVIDYWFNL